MKGNKKPPDAKLCLNHHLFQGPDLELLSDVSRSSGVSPRNAECVSVLLEYEDLGQNVFAHKSLLVKFTTINND